jgi:nucleoside-diphosphate-sugar epimerase
MKVLFIGGTGIISSACSDLAVRRGIDLFLLNRGRSERESPEGAKILHGDIREKDSAADALAGHEFDAVVEWIAFTPAHIETDLELFRNRTGQYIFISSASAYQTPPAELPVTEATPLANPFWEYSRAKIACENLLTKAFREENFPVTIVRPSHTYDRTLLPFTGGYTVVERMKKGKKAIVHGDGTSVWTLTNHRDFARGFTGLLGKSEAIGEAFHITSDELLTWNRIFETVAAAFDTNADLLHIPSDVIAAYDEEWGAGLLGDKAHSMIFDNSKIKRLVPEYRAEIPFAEGVKEIAEWFEADASRRKVDERLDALMDKIVSAREQKFLGCGI